MKLQSAPVTRAIVKDVTGSQTRRYAVTEPEEYPPGISKGETITFSIGSAWDEPDEPYTGQIVLLRDLKEFRGGWRALHASSNSQD